MESASQEGHRRIVDFAWLYKKTGKRKWSLGKSQSWNENGGKSDTDGGKNMAEKPVARKE